MAAAEADGHPDDRHLWLLRDWVAGRADADGLRTITAAVVEHHLPYLWWWANRVERDAHRREQVVAEAAAVAARKVRTYDATRGVGFTAYLRRGLLDVIWAVPDERAPVHLPPKARRDRASARAYQQHRRQLDGATPTAEEIAEALSRRGHRSVSAERAEALTRQWRTVAETTGGDGDPVAVFDRIAGDEGPDAEAVAVRDRLAALGLTPFEAAVVGGHIRDGLAADEVAAATGRTTADVEAAAGELRRRLAEALGDLA